MVVHGVAARVKHKVADGGARVYVADSGGIHHVFPPIVSNFTKNFQANTESSSVIQISKNAQIIIIIIVKRIL